MVIGNMFAADSFVMSKSECKPAGWNHPTKQGGGGMAGSDWQEIEGGTGV